MSEIHILQIEIRSKKLSFILEFLKNISFIKKVKIIESSEVEKDFIVPQWHKDVIESRRKTAKKEYLPLSNLDNEIRLSGK